MNIFIRFISQSNQ